MLPLADQNLGPLAQTFQNCSCQLSLCGRLKHLALSNQRDRTLESIRRPA